MSAFHYVAIDPKGQSQKGIIEAENSKHARQLLRKNGLIPLEMNEVNKKNTSKNSWTNFRKNQSLSSKELALLTRQLATLLSAGLPLEEVLAAVAEQTEKSNAKALVLAVRSKVIEGHSLANALADAPQAFSELYCSTVSAGEKSGHLEVVLERLADYTEQQAEMRQKIRHALIYPSIMILVSIGIVGFLLEYVVPKMVAVYSNTGQALPGLTQFLINISTGLKSYGLILLVILVLSALVFRYFYRKNLNFKTSCQTMLLKVPIIGPAINTANTARFLRTFSILTSAGVPVIEAMMTSSQLITSLPIRQAVEISANHVREGANINMALKQTHYFQPMTIHLIASGESSGQLEKMLERAATNQDNDVRQLIATTLTLFEPAIILVMGAIVLFIVLAVLLPIFQLDQFTG